MDYFNDVFTTFLGPEWFALLSMRGQKVSDLIKNILWIWTVLRDWNDMRVSN